MFSLQRRQLDGLPLASPSSSASPLVSPRRRKLRLGGGDDGDGARPRANSLPAFASKDLGTICEEEEEEELAAQEMEADAAAAATKATTMDGEGGTRGRRAAPAGPSFRPRAHCRGRREAAPGPAARQRRAAAIAAGGEGGPARGG